MNKVKIASLFAVSILFLLGVLGMIITHRLVLSEMETGLLSWDDDIIFLMMAYGIPVGLVFFGAIGATTIWNSTEIK